MQNAKQPGLHVVGTKRKPRLQREYFLSKFIGKIGIAIKWNH